MGGDGIYLLLPMIGFLLSQKSYADFCYKPSRLFFFHINKQVEEMVIMNDIEWPMLSCYMIIMKSSEKSCNEQRWKLEFFCWSLCSLLEYFHEKKLLPDYLWPWTPVGRFRHCLITIRQKKMLLDLCLFTFYSVHSRVHLVLAINRPDLTYPPDVSLLMQDSNEKLLQKYSCLI